LKINTLQKLKKLGFKIARIAGMIGVTRQHLTRYMNGQVRLSPQIEKKLKQALADIKKEINEII
jgi:transcriptional regulator with XRE-family HTH domain